MHAYDCRDTILFRNGWAYLSLHVFSNFIMKKKAEGDGKQGKNSTPHDPREGAATADASESEAIQPASKCFWLIHPHSYEIFLYDFSTLDLRLHLTSSIDFIGTLSTFTSLPYFLTFFRDKKQPVSHITPTTNNSWQLGHPLTQIHHHGHSAQDLRQVWLITTVIDYALRTSSFWGLLQKAWRGWKHNSVNIAEDAKSKVSEGDLVFLLCFVRCLYWTNIEQCVEDTKALLHKVRKQKLHGCKFSSRHEIGRL